MAGTRTKVFVSEKTRIDAAEEMWQDLTNHKDELKIMVGAILPASRTGFRIWYPGTSYGLSILKPPDSLHYAETAVLRSPAEIDEKQDPSFIKSFADFSTLRKLESRDDLIKEISRVRNMEKVIPPTDVLTHSLITLISLLKPKDIP
ncbi:MAG: hypothetical protein Hyperionvirus4_92 [Hyperionvirus sp.]|uniref:Uncharacterized protein n=1 Tax=Hyperionvirus sp. TaxID=2487770 RepID=A0A3G5A7B1_9VIRU|nr:MAG: hypothetical protein Hyperionvirus4_92 [Hyperionvirus sp.]